MAFVGHGTTVVFRSSGFIARATDLSFANMTREDIDVTTFSTSHAEKLESALNDGGELELTLLFNPDSEIPTDTETVDITWPNLRRWTGEMFVLSFEIDAPNDGLCKGVMRLKAANTIRQLALTTIKNDDGDEVYNDDGNLTYVAD